MNEGTGLGGAAADATGAASARGSAAPATMPGTTAGAHGPAVPATMPRTPHGGDVATYREVFGGEPLDFSANANPLGISPAARIAAADALRTADRYPDPLCRELRAALAERAGVTPAQVICGNGAADLIWRLVAALGTGAAGPGAQPAVGDGPSARRALVCAPTFSEYESALSACGWEVVRHELRRAEGFALTPRILDEIAPGVGLVFLCVPNNPTGLVPPRALLLSALERCEQVGARLVVDECFNGFLDDPAAVSLRGLVGAHPALLVLDAFTKLYGMAGLRLGYALCADEDLLARMRAAGQAWPVSSVAQAAGVAALADDAFVAQTRALVAQERPRLAHGLAALGCTVYPGQANYLFFESPVSDLYERLAARGVLVRDCANYPGLRAGDCRVAVRAPADNLALLRAVQAVLAEAGSRTQVGPNPQAALAEAPTQTPPRTGSGEDEGEGAAHGRC